MIRGTLTRMRRFLLGAEGPTAVEYAIMLALVFLVVLAAVRLIGRSTSSSMTESTDKIRTSISGGM